MHLRVHCKDLLVGEPSADLGIVMNKYDFDVMSSLLWSTSMSSLATRLHGRGEKWLDEDSLCMCDYLLYISIKLCSLSQVT